MACNFADLVECARNAAFDDRLEALNYVRVNGTSDVLALRVVNGWRAEISSQDAIADPLIGAEQADLVEGGSMPASDRPVFF